MFEVERTGPALPTVLDGPVMPSFKPTENTLDPYQLELCANVFRQTWSEIVPRGCRLPTREETLLQNDMSDKLCAFAAKGVTDPSMLQALTVAKVRFYRRTKPTLRGRHVYRGFNGGRGSAGSQPLQASGRGPTARGDLKKQIPAEQK